MAKRLVSIRMSDAGLALLEKLIEETGATQASVFEMGLRELARKQGIEAPEKKSADKPSTT